jgi:rRNA maturation RNase YbeY
VTTEYTFTGETFQLKHRNVLEETLKKIFKDFDTTETNLSYIFCSDDYLLEVNQQYLGHDYYTDVIPFSASHKDLPADIFISTDRIKDNASKYDVNFFDELYRVMIHAVLHLCGLNDADEQEKLQMKQNEDRYLEYFNRQVSKTDN